MARRFNRAARNGSFDGAGNSAIGKAFAGALRADFARHGASRIRKLRKRQPYDYLKLVASLLPQDFGAALTPALPPKTDEQFTRELEILSAFAAEYNKAHPANKG